MEERNSEGKMTWVSVATAILGVVGAAADQLLGSGLLSQWPVAVTIVGGILAVAVSVGAYTRSRPAKHAALAERERTTKLGTTSPSE